MARLIAKTKVEEAREMVEQWLGTMYTIEDIKSHSFEANEWNNDCIEVSISYGSYNITFNFSENSFSMTDWTKANADEGIFPEVDLLGSLTVQSMTCVEIDPNEKLFPFFETLKTFCLASSIDLTLCHNDKTIFRYTDLLGY